MCGESEAAAAILFGSPILCIPLTPDQIIIARKLTELGISLAVPAHQVSTNQIRDAILQLTMNRKYETINISINK
ncbi:hypothetical protein E2C01_069163 [Portunus trituberculatus]|uniref:Uncharacterized protein n=1 Tax=Portunus trituberculatus TaxID=210409 RepID=A0A5B7I1G0_PORTR|nr:hypothetical protein [Portunus trituberculatus]